MSIVHSKFRSSQNPNKLERNFYKVWSEMNRRCRQRTKSRNDKAYYDKGIQVCARWQKFEYFFIDMWDSYLLHKKLHKNDTELDRQNNEKGYCKSNCRWSTRHENMNNIGKNIRVNGMTFSEIAAVTGVKRGTVAARYFSGEPPERIFSKNKLTSLRGKDTIIVTI